MGPTSFTTSNLSFSVCALSLFFYVGGRVADLTFCLDWHFPLLQPQGLVSDVVVPSFLPSWSALRHHHRVPGGGGWQTASALWNHMLYLCCPHYVIITGCGVACRQRARYGIICCICIVPVTSSSRGAGGLADSERVTVGKLQVGLLGSARTLKRDLDRIAGKANTNYPSGLNYILQGASSVLSLRRFLLSDWAISDWALMTRRTPR